MLERLVEILQSQSLAVGYAFVFGVLLLCGFGFPMPEDVILVTGGVLIASLGMNIASRGMSMRSCEAGAPSPAVD